VRALMESVAYMLKRDVDLVQELGFRVSELRQRGGAERAAELWLRIFKADVLQLPVATVAHARDRLPGRGDPLRRRDGMLPTRPGAGGSALGALRGRSSRTPPTAEILPPRLRPLCGVCTSALRPMFV